MFSANNQSHNLTEKQLFMQDLEISVVTSVSPCGPYLPNMQQIMTETVFIEKDYTMEIIPT